MTLTEEIKINDALAETCVNAVYEENGLIAVDITGDWKHDHLRAEMIMNMLGYGEVIKKITEEDGSDWYSAIHYFTKS